MNRAILKVQLYELGLLFVSLLIGVGKEESHYAHCHDFLAEVLSSPNDTIR